MDGTISEVVVFPLVPVTAASFSDRGWPKKFAAAIARALRAAGT